MGTEVGVVLDDALGGIAVVDAGEATARSFVGAASAARHEVWAATTPAAARGAVAVGLGVEGWRGVAVGLAAAGSRAASSATRWTAVDGQSLRVLRGADTRGHAAAATSTGAVGAAEGSAVGALQGRWGRSGD